jgi:hypothetical protein
MLGYAKLLALTIENSKYPERLFCYAVAPSFGLLFLAAFLRTFAVYVLVDILVAGRFA